MRRREGSRSSIDAEAVGCVPFRIQRARGRSLSGGRALRALSLSLAESRADLAGTAAVGSSAQDWLLTVCGACRKVVFVGRLPSGECVGWLEGIEPRAN